MTGVAWRKTIRGFVLAAAVSGAATAALAETRVGESVESRVTLAFAVDAADLQPWLPEGWNAVPFARGPLAGANALLVFADQHAQTDADGKPKAPSAKRFAVLAGLGKEADGEAVRFFVYRVLSSDMSEDPYGNATLAAFTHDASTTTDADGKRHRSEAWTVSPAEGGGTLSMALEFDAGGQGWSASEANTWSNRIDGFNRIYRYRNLVELAMSAPMDKPLAGEVSYASDIAEFAAVFDGSETLVAILDIPVYAREIFLP